jgi:hypothetical protein
MPSQKKPIKLLVIADERGKIKAAAVKESVGISAGAHIQSGIVTNGQKIHEVELSDDLLLHSFMPILDDFHLKLDGSKATLVKRPLGKT